MATPGIYMVGKLVSAVEVAASTNRKTGEVYAAYKAVQILFPKRGGLIDMAQLQVPDLTPYKGKEDSEITVRVRPAVVNGALRYYLSED